MTPDEVIRALNLDDMALNNEKAQFIYSQENTYAELKEKMTDVFNNGKVNFNMNYPPNKKQCNLSRWV